MVSSMISGSLCQILTNPIWVIRIRMQSAIMHLSPEFDMEHYSTIWRSFRTIYQKEGIVGLYKGSLASQIGKGLGFIVRRAACCYQHASL